MRESLVPRIKTYRQGTKPDQQQLSSVRHRVQAWASPTSIGGRIQSAEGKHDFPYLSDTEEADGISVYVMLS